MSKKIIKFGNFTFPEPVIALAPMAGISDLPFRNLCEFFGADFCVSEMVSADKELLQTDLSQKRLLFSENLKAKIVQLLGSDYELMAEAAQFLSELKVDLIDINLGCPARRVNKNLAGSALLKDLDLVAKILDKIRGQVATPISIKTRLGYDNKRTIFELGKIASAYKISHLSVHARTRQQFYSGEVDYEILGEFATECEIPVIANGDINDLATASDLLEKYPFAGIMIGRAARGNPQFFSQLQNKINDKELIEFENKYIKVHLKELHDFYGEKAVKIARQHLHFYLAKHPQYQRIRSEINSAENKEMQLAILDNL